MRRQCTVLYATVGFLNGGLYFIRIWVRRAVTTSLSYMRQSVRVLAALVFFNLFNVACNHSPSNMRRSARYSESDVEVKILVARVVNSPSYLRRSVRYFTAYVR